MLKEGNKTNVYPPEETTITSNVTFCILGDGKLVVFLGVEPPPNTPNKMTIKPKSAIKVPKTLKEESTEIQELCELLESTKKENLSLKEELEQSKKRISELEKEVEELKTEKSKENKGSEIEKSVGFGIIDTETLSRYHSSRFKT